MADEQQGLGISGTTIVSVIAAAALALFYGQHLLLQDRRPTVEPSSVKAAGLQQIDARLWEDPFFAAQHFFGSGETKKEQNAEACARIEHDGPPTRTLMVILPGGPYEQAAETRRRTRYAVVSALHHEGYDPVDPEHLGCFGSASQTTPIGQGSGGEIASVIPFEVFVNVNDGQPAKQRVSVAWVDENRLRGEPSDYYTVLAKTQEDFRTALGVDAVAEPVIRIVGPYSSRVLTDLAAAQNLAPPAKTFVFFNYAATIDLQATVTSPAFPQKGCQLAEPLANGGVSFCQVVQTDGALSQLLANEVANRTSLPDLSDRKRVALIYESDTLYGRALSKAVRKEMGASHVATDDCPTDALSYMRGLDGSLPSRAKSVAPAPETTPSSEAEGTAQEESLQKLASPPYQLAEGNAQLDYLEHLPGPLHQLEQSGREACGKYTAIGLLGTDAYDKLLLLRALRPHFPDAVFFTTDLDARLFDPTEFPTTRGLIVASSFGLRPALGGQTSVPSFRDTYQTAAFLATALAIAEKPTEDAPILRAAQAGARIFEIGRWGPLRLESASPRVGPVAAFTSAVACTRNDEELRDHGPPFRRAASLCLAVGFWIFLVLEFGLWRRPRRATALLFALAAGLFFIDALPFSPPGLAKRILTHCGAGEPLSLSAGISLWPVIGLRLLGALFCINAAQRIMMKLRANVRSISDTFGLDENEPDMACLPRLGIAATFMRGIRAAALPSGLPPEEIAPSIFDASAAQPSGNLPGHGNVIQIWRRLQPSAAPPRWFRSAVYTMALSFTFVCLGFAVDVGRVPARGYLAPACYVATTLLDLVMMQLVVMLVYDATAFSTYFIRSIRKVETSGWPRQTVDMYRRKTGLQNERLLADWVDMQMIATRTACIIELIYLPFIALSIFTISESSIFDDLPLCLPLLASSTVGFGLLFYMGRRLRTEAEKVRRETVERFEAAIRVASLNEEPHNLIACLVAVKEFRQGAFAKWSQQPLVRAILLPLSSIGGSAILQQFLVP